MSRNHGTLAAARKTKPHTIKLERPGATSVAITGSFCDWTSEGRPLKRDGERGWKVDLALPPGRYEYRFLVDGRWEDDPNCVDRVPNQFGSENCVFVV